MATGSAPFPFQRGFAEAASLPQLVRVPTGLGKTALAVVGWLWRRFGGNEERKAATPRRLVYCLPMRVLVEQTRDNAVLWLHNVGLLAGPVEFDEHDGKRRVRSYAPDFSDPGKVAVHVLMGGEERDDWDLHPERDAIIIGTQDMLLSRALNRGYAMTRSRWPMHFALLNSDVLWILDEVQLMGTGLATTAQLEAFRSLLGTGGTAQSIWMSATLDREWLRSADLDLGSLGDTLELDARDLALTDVAARYRAPKRLAQAAASAADPDVLAQVVLDEHQHGTRTLVVVNTVDRARRLAAALRKRLTDGTGSPGLVLIHSRFRPLDRERHVGQLLAAPEGPGAVIVSTQVVEAGVDVSAKTLFTEIAPWASLVQRFGRCNRAGEFDNHDDPGRIFWIDLNVDELDEKRASKTAAPYPPHDLHQARKLLVELEGESVAPQTLDGLGVKLPYEHTHILRRKDLIELFDTTPDLAGNDLDIDRYVRDMDDTDVRVFWRDLRGEAPQPEEALPGREELCGAPVGGFRDFIRKLGKSTKKHIRVRRAYRRNFLERTWDPVSERTITPGQVYFVDSSAGGYDEERGWMGEIARTAAQRVAPVALEPGEGAVVDDGNEADKLSQTNEWQSIAEHTDEVCAELEQLLGGLETVFAPTLRVAARWHDWGKAHQVFQDALPDGRPDASRAWAKAPGKWKRYGRRQFRHELASALAVLALTPKTVGLTVNGGAERLSVGAEALGAEDLRDLAAYLVAAHHGKVRLSIRSLPTEKHPPDGKRFARGIWDGDRLSKADLGGGVLAPGVALSLEPMELGLCQEPPFAGQPSWVERMLCLRDRLGPFRLAYLEALLRAADMRASARATRGQL
ncbi:MAG: CRISPR-associated helicase Cas3' [Gemmatimonadetes bacterium]|nr:CRISPR-associated helicase Cas3' [Gemmatimonadota bacterium]